MEGTSMYHRHMYHRHMYDRYPPAPPGYKTNLTLRLLSRSQVLHARGSRGCSPKTIACAACRARMTCSEVAWTEQVTPSRAPLVLFCSLRARVISSKWPGISERTGSRRASPPAWWPSWTSACSLIVIHHMIFRLTALCA